jgi:hypothetical protein
MNLMTINRPQSDLWPRGGCIVIASVFEVLTEPAWHATKIDLTKGERHAGRAL